MTPKERAIEQQQGLFEQLRIELDTAATWADLAKALNVNQVRISQWRSTKGMRLDTILAVLGQWNTYASSKKKRRAAWSVSGDGCEVVFQKSRRKKAS